MEGKATVGTQGRSESGFSLLEVMIAASVLVGALMGLGLAMVSSYRLDRMAMERKAALAFATSQIEKVRGMRARDIVLRPRYYNELVSTGGFLPPTSWGTTGSGTNAAVGTVAGAGSVGFTQTLDGDSDEDYFGIYFTRQVAPVPPSTYWQPNYIWVNGGFYVTTSDALLNSLTPIPRFGGRMAQITFREPDATTGLAEDSGYWVTVKVFWQGSSGGEQEQKLCTFVSK